MSTMNDAERSAGRWRKARLVVAIAAIGLVAVVFLSGVAIFAYQMLRAG